MAANNVEIVHGIVLIQIDLKDVDVDDHVDLFRLKRRDKEYFMN